MMPLNCPVWPPRWPEIDAALAAALQSGEWGRYHAPIVTALQQRLADIFQAQVRLCCSGTAALEIALRALGVGSGDEVIVAAYDYPGNLRTIELVGACPVLIDVTRDSLSIDAHQLERASSDRVRAVIASHLYGQHADAETLRAHCERRGWVLIEDTCQSAGMRIDGRLAGTFGHLATLSFGGSKLISAGCGGALVVRSEPVAARLGALLDRPADAFPLSPLQAAVIGPQLDRLEELNRARSQTVQFLRSIADTLPRWRWAGRHDARATTAHYKLAWQADGAEHRERILAAAEREGVPLGAGFRAMSRCSPRRCRKPVDTPVATELGQTLFLLDHTALLIEPQRHAELADYLIRIHQASEQLV
jgi:dTDP-4-amino-4,6-dideoxygalactose transaminase